MLTGRCWILLLGLMLSVNVSAQPRERLLVAAASSLGPIMGELTSDFARRHPGLDVRLSLGSSGKLYHQIVQGAPFDLFYSADTWYPQQLVNAGKTSGPVRIYARGRLVLWSKTLDVETLGFEALSNPGVKRIALANPQHAPYGMRAREFLQARGLWEPLKPKLVFGENIAQAAQFAQTGNAQLGLLARSLMSSPQLMDSGGYWLVPESGHQPLEQGYVVLKPAAGEPAQELFVDYMSSPEARAIFEHHGFSVPSRPY